MQTILTHKKYSIAFANFMPGIPKAFLLA